MVQVREGKRKVGSGRRSMRKATGPQVSLGAYRPLW